MGAKTSRVNSESSGHPQQAGRDSLAFPLSPGDKEALILKHYELVKFIAMRMGARLPSHVCLDDLFNAGVIGLIDAIDKFDPDQGILFETYAKFRIRGAMLDEIRSMDWVSRSLRQKSTQLQKTCSALEQRLGRFPADEEIADEMNLSLEDYFKLLDKLKSVSFIPEDIYEMIQDNRESHALTAQVDEPFDETYKKELRAKLAEAISTLTEKEQLVLSLYYYEELTMKEIGAVMEYTESRISQIHTKAILKLKTRLAERLRPEDLPDRLHSASALQ